MPTSARASRRNLRKAVLDDTRTPGGLGGPPEGVVSPPHVTASVTSASVYAHAGARQAHSQRQARTDFLRRGGGRSPCSARFCQAVQDSSWLLAALLVSTAVTWASTVVTYSAVGQTMVYGQTASNATSGVTRLEPRLSPDRIRVRPRLPQQRRVVPVRVHSNAAANPFSDATGGAFLARAWCRNNSGFDGVARDLPDDEALAVVPEHVGSSGPPWRLRAAMQLSPKEVPDEASR